MTVRPYLEVKKCRVYAETIRIYGGSVAADGAWVLGEDPRQRVRVEAAFNRFAAEDFARNLEKSRPYSIHVGHEDPAVPMSLSVRNVTFCGATAPDPYRG